MAKYKNDFLDRVIVRLDFDTTLPFSKSKPPIGIYEPLKERFPITEEKKVIGQQLSISPQGTSQKNFETLEWVYYGLNRKKSLKITPDHIVIEYLNYEYYEQLKEDFSAVIDELFNKHGKLNGSRLGFRYIDNIELSPENPTDFDKYIKPSLNMNLDIVNDRSKLSRVFHIMEFNYGNSNLRFQYGILNPDYPATIKKKIYTLDFDMYTNRLLNKSEVIETLDEFHEKLTSSFEDVITDALRELMGKNNE